MPRKHLSEKPTSIRQRLRRSTRGTERDLELLAEVQGREYKPIAEWDFEELARGKPRLANGTWPTGGAPKWMTPMIADEVSRRLREGFIAETRAELPSVLKVLRQLLKDDDNPRIQLDAAKLYLEYAVGAPEKRVAITNTSRVEHLLADVVVLDDGSPAHPVIDGQFYEEEESDDDLPSGKRR